METIHEVLPKQGMVEQDAKTPYILCKPKLLPIKSISLQKLEDMQKEAQEIVKALEAAEAEAGMMGLSGQMHDGIGDGGERLTLDSSDYEALIRQQYYH